MKSRLELGSVSVAFVVLGTLTVACGGDDSGSNGIPDTTSTANSSGGSGGGSGGTSSSTSGASGGSGGTSASGGSGSGTGGNGIGGSSSSAGGAAGDAGAAGASGAAGADATSGGGSSTEPVCGGTAVECSTYTTDATCATQLGCSVGGACDGDARCSAHGDRNACESDGCEWLTPCMPVANCDALGAAPACEAQGGCEWDEDAETCAIKLSDGCVDVTSEAECTLLASCVWADENFFCAGTATACEELDEDVCSLQEGCSEL